MQNNNLQKYWDQLILHQREGLFGLYKELYSDLLNYGRALIKDEELTKDVINQLFLYLWDKHQKLASPREIKSYILVSFRRMLLYESKKQQQYHPFIATEATTAELQQASAEFDKISAETNSEVITQLKDALNALSPRQKELLRMKYYDNLSYEEIAERTGLSIRTVYNKTHEALQRLRKILGPKSSGNSSLIILILLLELAGEQL
ncbi:hypothetical protein DVR12_19900 [Chitinophaga silvatica]|uniref:RNA polymerase sigma factor 70 region 4 type 2 domain-containing protein n=1 Tax=Chitinophaga silvatica TaxID=2282649 RepID=A0A3E1Y5J8_9BACT|nr:sigma-70 family RNA polymerase sigma factor [Chitinophaga silvatica]RFS19992.1 hypothetical protein DVR12_19900 [Chitinophaga silvatica]